MIAIGVCLTVIGSMMNSNIKSKTGVLLAVAGVALALGSLVMKGDAA